MTNNAQPDYLTEHYPAAAALVRQGWTVESAMAHIDGSCDRWLCTHPAHRVDQLIDELAGQPLDVIEVDSIEESQVTYRGAVVPVPGVTFTSSGALDYIAGGVARGNARADYAVRTRTVHIIRTAWK